VWLNVYKTVLITLVLCMSFQTCYAKSKFNDVQPGTWYYESVSYAIDRGFVNGYGDGTFRPDQEITVIEALHISLKVLGYKQPSDRDWKEWTEEIATRLQLIQANEFQVLDAPILRQEMALIGLRTLDQRLESDYMGISNKIKDIESTDYYWQQVLIRAYAHGLYTGYADGTTRPLDHLTRAEAVTVINRIHKKL